ncbi:uncharacterized protein JCM6883_000829 [Sporobolomyces salmoneus]|uniref:uncharacterized protein n=1 Tax=Sporobolomyces salmoneus TaxID=183962 RepID=UPI00316CE469
MTSITLNADVLRLIIRQTADEAERQNSHSPIDAFYQRASTLRRLCLVNSQWRPLAQLELESFVVLTARNFGLVSRALNERGIAKRVRRFIDKRGTTRDQRPFDELLEKCGGLRELECNGSRFSLNSLKAMKHLHTLSFSNVTLSGDTQKLELPFRLRSFTLFGSSGLSQNDWRALREAGTKTLEHLEIVGRLSSNPSPLLDALSAWLPSVRSLIISDVLSPTPLVPSLHLCRRLERLAVKLSDFPSVLAVVGCSPRHLEIVASSEILDEWTLIDYQSNVLYAVGREPLDRLETVKVSRAPGIHDSLGSRETALLVKIGKRKGKTPTAV